MKTGRQWVWAGSVMAWLSLIGLLIGPSIASAQTVTNPQSATMGLSATIPESPPSVAATITTPTNGAVLNTQPITVAGTCQGNVLVKVFSNNVFIGSAECQNSSYSMQVSLFAGQNQLVAREYDALDQAGPDSATVTVTFKTPFVSSPNTPQLTLTSLYAERGANPGQTLTWPIIINGGNAPYALSVNWGDGSLAEPVSAATSGSVNITHVYSSAGTYTVFITSSDASGQTAVLQLVGVANGAVISKPNAKNSTCSSGSTNCNSNFSLSQLIKNILIITVPLLIVAFWLGGRNKMHKLNRRFGQIK